jgi:AhpD family alkylhydroperoxidase
MRPFPRRCYRDPLAPLVDVARVLAHPVRALLVALGWRLGPAFRERLMLAVTEVNGCRYCTWVHARLALCAGLAAAEVAGLLGRELAGAPPEERAALLFARAWADSGGRPDSATRARLEAEYGADRALDIEVALRLIQVGNLWGNTLDCALHGLSRGRWGG